MDALQNLIDYTCWANKIWLDAVFATFSDDEYQRRMISHIYLAEQVWFRRIYGEEVSPSTFLTLERGALLEMADRHASRYNAVIGSGLSRVIAYHKFNGEPQESSILEILNHLVTHGAHHRGQMAAHASQRGIKPPDTAYITYARQKAG